MFVQAIVGGRRVVEVKNYAAKIKWRQRQANSNPQGRYNVVPAGVQWPAARWDHYTIAPLSLHLHRYFEYNRNHQDKQDIISLKPWPVSNMGRKVVSSVVYCNVQSRGAKVTRRGKFSPFNCSPSRVGIITRQASLRNRSISGRQGEFKIINDFDCQG